MENNFNNKDDENSSGSGIEWVHKTHTVVEEYKEPEKKTVADYLNEALESKGQNIDYVYLQFTRDVKKSIRNTPKSEIKKWFAGKSYPNLDQMYKLAYILPIDPDFLWKLKTEDEKKEQRSSASGRALGDMISRGAGKNELLLLSLLYGFLLVTALFVAMSVRGYFTAVNYNEQQSENYIEGAIDAGVDYAANITGDEDMAKEYHDAVTENARPIDANSVQEALNKYGKYSNVVLKIE